MALFQKQADIKALKQYSQEQQALPVGQRVAAPQGTGHYGSLTTSKAPAPGAMREGSPEHQAARKKIEMQMAQQEIEDRREDPREPGDVDQRNRRARNQALAQRARSGANKKIQKQAAGWSALSNIDTAPRELIVKPPTE